MHLADGLAMMPKKALLCHHDPARWSSARFIHITDGRWHLCDLWRRRCPGQRRTCRTEIKRKGGSTPFCSTKFAASLFSFLLRLCLLSFVFVFRQNINLSCPVDSCLLLRGILGYSGEVINFMHFQSSAGDLFFIFLTSTIKNNF